MKRATVVLVNSDSTQECISFDSVEEVVLDKNWLLFHDEDFSEIGGVPFHRVVSWRIEEVKD